MLKKLNEQITNLVQSPRWFYAFCIGVALCLVAYISNVLLANIHPGNAWGLTYGTTAAVLMLGAALYGVRRRTMRWGIGIAQTWLQFHLYGGALFFLLLLMHTGFKIPSGVITWWLWFLSIWITLTGFLGVWLHKWLPKLLSSGLSIEVLYDRIPELVREIQAKTEGLIASCDEPIREFYQNHLAPALAGPQFNMIYYLDISGGINAQARRFDHLKKIVVGEQKKKVGELEQFYKTKLEIDAHYTLQKALRTWLFLHVPVSILVVLLLVLHVYSVWYY